VVSIQITPRIVVILPVDRNIAGKLLISWKWLSRDSDYSCQKLPQTPHRRRALVCPISYFFPLSFILFYKLHAENNYGFSPTNFPTRDYAFRLVEGKLMGGEGVGSRMTTLQYANTPLHASVKMILKMKYCY
jgi:hypothetical protein